MFQVLLGHSMFRGSSASEHICTFPYPSTWSPARVIIDFPHRDYPQAQARATWPFQTSTFYVCGLHACAPAHSSPSPSAWIRGDGRLAREGKTNKNDTVGDMLCSLPLLTCSWRLGVPSSLGNWSHWSLSGLRPLAYEMAVRWWGSPALWVRSAHLASVVWDWRGFSS